jgi:hypothetical protein
MLTDTKPEPSKTGRRRIVLYWVWFAICLVLLIVFIGAEWIRALDMLLYVIIFFSIMVNLRDKPVRGRVADTEEGKGPSFSQSMWGSLLPSGLYMLNSFLRNHSNIYILDRQDLVQPMVLVFAICMLAWLPFAFRNPKRKIAVLVAVICAACFAFLGTAGLNCDLDEGTPISTEARCLRISQSQYVAELELPDGSVVGISRLYWEPKVTPVQPNAMVDFKCYQGPLGIRYATRYDDSSWKGNPFAITYHRLRDWLARR